MEGERYYMKRIVAIVCAFAILMFGTNSYAEEKMYSSKEVEDIISEACTDNNIEFSYVYVEPEKVFAQREVDDMIANLLAGTDNTIFPIMVPVNNMLVKNKLQSSIYAPNYMERHIHFTDEKYITNDMYSGATIGIEMDTTVNLGSNTFVSVDSLSSRPYGYNLNFVSWNQISADYSFSSDYKTVNVTIKGTLYTAMKVSNQATVGLFKDHTITTSASLN